MKKKLMATLLALTLLATCLTGCGNGGDDKTTAGDAGKTTGASVDNGTTEEPTTEEEDVVLKVVLCLTDSYKNTDIDEIAAIKRLDEAAGVTTEWEIVRVGAWDTWLTTTLAGDPKDYPDLIISRNGKVDREEYGVDQGILMPLDDLIDEYLTNYTDRIADCVELEGYDPTASLKSSDGKTYTIGYMSAENISTWTQYYINQTWLKALNLETPADVEGLTEVFRAFKTKDPNGNGKADEIPLTFTMSTSGTDNLSIGYMLPLFGIPFGGANSWLYVDDNAEVQFIPTQEGFRECMEWLHTLYIEELLDIEALSQDAAAVNRKLEDNVVGFVSQWRFFEGTSYAETAGKDMALYIPGKDAQIYHYMELASARVYLTSKNEHPEKTMQWLNAYLDTENMFDLMNGHHNQDKDPSYSGWYYDENGIINTLSKPKELELQDYFAGNGLFFAPGPYKAETLAWTASGLEKIEANDVYEESVAYQKYSNDYLKLVSLSVEQSSEKTLMDADFATAINEYMAKFIMEGVSDAKWNEFVGIMNNIGCDDYVDMHQEALDTLSLNK